MTRYSIQTLKNMITDWIHENHSRNIDGMTLQETLHDILDSVVGYAGEINGFGAFRSATISIPAGLYTITFIEPFPLGTVYVVSPIAGHTEDDDLIWRLPVPGSMTVEGFDINFDKPVNLTYLATIVT